MFKNSQKLAISKHFLIAALFIVLMFTSVGVCMDDAYASDLNESVDVVGSELNVEDKLENSQDNILNSNNVDESLASSVENDEVLGVTLNGGTFRDITRAINNANAGDTIKLTGTFYASGSDDTISVSKRVTLTSDSQATLDGKGISRVLYVKDNAAGSVLKNLKIVNGYSTVNGAGLYITAKNVKVSNCVFENNHGLDGAALHSVHDAYRSENLVVENCRFYKNWANRCAGAAGVFGNNSKITNCVFDSNYASGFDTTDPYGGAVQVGMDDPISVVYVRNCQFLNNHVDSDEIKAHGGAGCVRAGSVYENCIFINNSAAQGGALTFHASGLIKNCTFKDNTATLYGGALSTGYLETINLNYSFNILDLNVKDSSFINNSAPYGGAAYLIGVDINIDNSEFKGNHVTQTGGAINIVAKSVTISDSSFDGNIANVDGGAVFITGKNTLIQDSSFRHNEAIPDVNKLDDGLGGAIYINSTHAIVKNNDFYYNTARNGSAIYYDKCGNELKLTNNVLFENQAWVYALPIYAHDIYYGQTEQIKSVIHGGNNIGDYDNLAVSNAIYNAADNQKITVNGEIPVSGATTSGRLYQDDREYNIEVLMTVVHEDGTVAYNNTLNSNCFGEVFDNLNNLKVGKYYVTARHYEDTYYKAITNTTTFKVIANVDNKVKKLVTDEEINYEDVVVWTLNITNNGPNNATNVVVTDVLPEGLIWLDDDTNGKYDPQTGVLRVGFLAVGDVIVVNIITMVNKTGTIVNNVNITAKEYDYNLTNNFDEERITVQPASDLAVVKVVNQSMPKYNDLVKWTVTVTNNGPDVAHDVKVQDVLPRSLAWVSDTGSGKYNHDTGVWDIGTLNVGSSASLNIVTRVKATGTIKNDASVSGREYDNNMSNNHDDEIIKVNPATDLAIAKLVNVSTANFGDLVKWTLVVSNNGPDAATGVKVSDVLPRGFVYVSSTKPLTNGVINIGNLAVGQSQSVDIITRANATGSFVNVANVSGNEYDYDMSNNRAEKSLLINPASDLAVVKVVNNSTPKFNDLVKWTITVTNNGPDVAHDVKVQDVLPKSLIFVSTTGNYNNNSGIWTIGTLNVKASTSLSIVTRVNATGAIRNDVSVSGREYDYDMSNNKDSKSINVNPATDLAIAKLVNVSTANFGDLVKWTLVVSNNGPDAATGVKVSDVLPRGFVYISSTKPLTNGVINIGNLAVGQSQGVDIVTRVNVTGTFVNVANVSGNEYDYDMSNNRAEKSVVINPASDLAVVKVVNETSPNYNSLVKWTITVKNNGPDVAHDVKVSDVLPRSLIFVSTTGNYNKNTGVWSIGTLNVGSSTSLSIVTRVNATGAIRNDVSVSGREYDYDMSNNRDSKSINVKPATDLAIAKLVNVSSANFGDLVKWTLVVSNNGPDAATGVKVTDVLPRGFVYVSSTKPLTNGVINIGNLAVGQSQRVNIVTRANITGNHVNMANVSGNEYDYDLSNNRANKSILINPASDLAVVKAVNETSPNYNSLVKWTITVKNNGPDVAHDVKVSDVLPRSLIFVSTTGNYNKNTGVWSIGTLNVGSSTSLSIVTRVNATGIIRNDVSVSGREYDYDMSNNRNSKSIDVKPSTDLAIAKLVNVSTANFGDLVKWTLVVSNNGPDAATGVKVSDVLPRGFVYVSSTKPLTNGVINIGNLAVGQSQRVDIVTRVNVTGTFVNVANVTGNEYDHDMSNNRANKSILINPASDLAVVKAVNETSPNYNSLVKWTITVRNNGPDVAHDVKVSDVLPRSLIFVSTTGNYNKNTGVWSIGTLDVGSSTSLSIVTRVNATGAIRNDVSVSGREYDYDMSNNKHSKSIDVKPAADLAIAKLVNVSSANFGDLVKWTLVVSNNGPDAATGVKITDVLPKGFIYVSSSKPYSNNVINIGNLAVGQSQRVDIVTRVNVTGTFVNVANVTGNEYDHDMSNNRANKSILINPASDLIVEKTVNETAPNYHDMVKWTITVTNNGPDTAHDVKVQDILPESLIFVSSNGNYNKDSGIWNVGTLNKGAKASLVIITKVNKTGVIQNNVSVTGREYDYNKSNNKNNKSIDVPNATDLSVVKLVNSSVENYHELIKWTVIATNNGPDKATGVYVMDVLPEGLVLINYTASKGFYDNGMWSVCCMESGDSETLDIICYINRTGDIINVVNITGNEYDYDLSNNEAEESVFVPDACDMAVIKTVNDTNPYFGEVIEWDITITNNGPDTANEVYAFDSLPKGLKYLDYEASKGTYDGNGMWYVPSLRVGESANLLIRCEVNSLENMRNTVSVSALEYDWNKSNNKDSEEISVNPVCDLSITKLVNVSQANYLDLVKWTLIVTNNGPNDATDVYASDVIPKGLKLIRAEGDGEYENSLWHIGDLKSGQSNVLNLICKVIETGEFDNFANVWGNEYDPDLSNNEDEESLLVNPASDLSITKTVSKYKYNVGDLVKYSIKVVNNGPDKATNVEVREIMDDSLLLKSFWASYGEFDEETEVWSIDELDVGDSASLNIDAIAEEPGVARNNVSVKSDNYDPDLTNNEDSVDVNVTQKPKKEDIPKNHHVTKSNKEISVPYQSMLQNYVSGNPLVMMLVSVVFLLLVPCGISFSKKR